MSPLTKRSLALLVVVANLTFLSWFVNRYAHHYLVQVTAVAVACLWLQKAGGAIAIGDIGWAIRGRSGSLARLSEFNARQHPAYLAGFAVNRIGSLVPPLYTLSVTWGRLPLLLMLYLAADAAVAVWTALHFENWVRQTAIALSELRQRKGKVEKQ